jgi:hypothetical protein
MNSANSADSAGNDKNNNQRRDIFHPEASMCKQRVPPSCRHILFGKTLPIKQDQASPNCLLVHRHGEQRVQTGP